MDISPYKVRTLDIASANKIMSLLSRSSLVLFLSIDGSASLEVANEVKGELSATCKAALY